MSSKYDLDRARYLRDAEEKLYLVSEPTYTFNVGDVVKFGGFDRVEVVSSLYGGRLYEVKVWSKDECTCRVVAWTSLRPIEVKETSLITNKDLSLDYTKTSLREVIETYYYHFGVDMSPDYQRDYVWNPEDEVALIDSIYSGVDIGKMVLVRRSTFDDYMYEILDGKQRLNTLVRFYENRFSYKGYFYNDLSYEDRRHFSNTNIAVAKVSDVDRRTILRYFIMLNTAGHIMDASHLDNVREMLKNAL